jgi:hypothetical protein
MIIKNQLIKLHSNLFITKRYNQNSKKISVIFKDSDLYILASFSNFHLKDNMYYTTASTIFSETPFEFNNKIVIKERLTVMNMTKLHLLVIDDVPTSNNRTLNTKLVKNFSVTTLNYDTFFSNETITSIFKEDRFFNNNNVFFYFKKAD